MAGDIYKDREKASGIIDEIAPFYEKGAAAVCADETTFAKYLSAEEKQIRIFSPTLARKKS